MSGAASWTLEELEHVASLFGETLGEAVALVEAQGYVSGTAKFGDATVPCNLWIGAEVQNPSPDSVVAV
jgi:hypothetical protein